MGERDRLEQLLDQEAVKITGYSWPMQQGRLKEIAVRAMKRARNEQLGEKSR